MYEGLDTCSPSSAALSNVVRCTVTVVRIQHEQTVRVSRYGMYVAYRKESEVTHLQT